MERPEPDLVSHPMEEQYQTLIQIYNYFNRRLFGGILPRCILSFSREHRTNGYLIPERWHRTTQSETAIHEICLSPVLLQNELETLFISLVHEMVHLWQWEYGKPSRRSYHNREWANKMEEVGLMPSDTGKPNGKRIGQTVSQYVLEGGLYQSAYNQLPKELLLPFISDLDKTLIKDEKTRLVAKVNRGKTKYSCPECQANVWGKPNLAINCGKCNQAFQVIK